MDRVLASRGRRFRHHHAAAHTDRGENHDPTGTLITAQALNGGLDRPARNKRTVPADVSNAAMTTITDANAVLHSMRTSTAWPSVLQKLGSMDPDAKLLDPPR